MAEMRTASENHRRKSLVLGGSSTANVLIETQLKSELLSDTTFKEEGIACNLPDEEPAISKGAAEKIAIPVVEEEREGQVGCKDEVSSESGTKETPLVGRVKIKPLASLVETEQPNPKPGVLSPFASGFDNHIHSLEMNRHPQIESPSDQLLYYGNSTSMNLEKIAQTPVSRFHPYAPNNVPRPPRPKASMRNSSSAQIPPIVSERLDVPAGPSTSLRTVNHLNDLSRPNFTPANKHSLPITTSQSLILGNSDQKPNGVSSSNTDDLETCEDKEIIKTEVDLENGMNEELPDKFRPTEVDLEIELKEELPDKFRPTEVDLEIELKEELPDTFRPTEVVVENKLNNKLTGTQTEVKAENKSKEELETYCTIGNFIDVSDADPCVVQPELPIDPLSTTTSEVAKTQKRKPVYELPTYRTTGTYSCKCCDFRCDKKCEIKEHTKEMHTAENNFKCFYCVKDLARKCYHSTLSALEYHVAKVHRGMKLWQCKKCSKSYKYQKFYQEHIDKHCSNFRPYACHKCTFTCMTEAALEKHLKSHEKIVEMEPCPFCNKSIKKYNMKLHVTLMHEPFEGKRFQCISCNHAVGTQSALESHYKTTSHDKKFKCYHCKRTSRSKKSMKHHIKLVHLKVGGEKFVCGVNGCEETTYSTVSMTYHRKIHSTPDSELFTCPASDCLKKYRSFNGLNYHLRTTKHYLPFQCSDCPDRFQKESTLREHVQKKHVTGKMKNTRRGRPRKNLRKVTNR